MQLIIDDREQHLIELLKQPEFDSVPFTIDRLDIGDCVYLAENQTISCIIERKSITDYADSIKTGRLKNQSLRLTKLTESQCPVIIYLIEGTVPLSRRSGIKINGISRTALYSSWINKIFRDQFVIYRTFNLYDSALVVAKIYQQLSKILGQKVAQSQTKTKSLEYLKTLQVAKKDQLTPAQCYLCQLAQIPNVSIAIASHIARVYSNMSELLQAYQQSDDRSTILSEIKIPLASHKERRLGHVLSQRIGDYLLPVKKIRLTKRT